MDLHLYRGDAGCMRNISSLSAPALVLCSVVSIQFGQALGKGLFDSVEPSGVVALRLGIAAVVLLLICRPSLRRAWTDRAVILGFGTAIAGMNLVYPALHYLPTGVATSLQLLGPIALALVSSRRWSDVVFVALAATGVGLFSGSPSGAYPVAGIVLALASGASMAGYLLMSRRAGTRSAGAEPLAWAVTWAALVTVPVGVFDNGASLFDVRIVVVGAVVAVLSAVVPYSLELAALRRPAASNRRCAAEPRARRRGDCGNRCTRRKPARRPVACCRLRRQRLEHRNSPPIPAPSTRTIPRLTTAAPLPAG